MAFPRRSSSTPRSRATFGLLILTAVSLLVLDLPGTGPLRPIRNVLASAFSPIRSAGDAILEPFSNGWKGAFGYGDLKAENDRLRAELAATAGQDADVERLQDKVRDLERLNGIAVEDLRLLTAEVVSAPLNNFDHSVEIDQGSGDGVKSGMAVVTTGNAVFGRINTTTGGRSTVTLVTTADFQVGVRLADGTRAVAQGQGRDRPLLIDSVEVTRAKVGDWVYTSGVEQSPFPKDLKIGKVTKVDTIPGQGTTLEVEPLADLSSVYVKVVLKDPPK
ncbi:MAG TPA: rod shape-determining protein MreC [Acidimicrobiales bacterium]|nr:rod shape-determining protein MreC [Acidimicrobiales bacterium]